MTLGCKMVGMLFIIVAAGAFQVGAEIPKTPPYKGIEFGSIGGAIRHEYYDNCWMAPGAASYIAGELDLGWVVVPSVRCGGQHIQGTRSYSREFAILQFGRKGDGGWYGSGEYCLVDTTGRIRWRGEYEIHASACVSDMGVTAILHRRYEVAEMTVVLIDHQGRETRSVTFPDWTEGGVVSSEIAHEYSFGHDGLFYLALRHTTGDSLHVINPSTGLVCTAQIESMLPVDMRPSDETDGVVFKAWDTSERFRVMLSVEAHGDCTMDDPVVLSSR